jgi:hypothetical protein
VNVGDIVTANKGTPTTEHMRQIEALVSGATPQLVRYRAMQDVRIGAAGQRTTLTLQTLKGESYTVTVTRQPADDYPLRGPALREARLPRFTELEPGYFYVDLDRFHDDDFSTDVLPKFTRAKGVVFDVRGYPTVSPGFLGQLTDRPLSSERKTQDRASRRTPRGGASSEAIVGRRRRCLWRGPSRRRASVMKERIFILHFTFTAGCTTFLSIVGASVINCYAAGSIGVSLTMTKVVDCPNATLFVTREPSDGKISLNISGPASPP